MKGMRRLGTGVILISALVAIAVWLQPDKPAPIAAPRPPTSRALDPKDVPHLLERFIARHAKAPDRGVFEARLLALALPDAVGPLLDRIASDPARTPGDRRFAIRILRSVPQAEETLERLALRLDRDVSGAALESLCRRDLRGAHLQIYLAGCGAGIPEAFDAISHWADPGTIAFMKKPAVESDAARRVMGRYEILLAADWAQRIEEILREPCHERNALASWALHVARSRALPGLAGALRERLDSGDPDPFRDDAMIALSELGGQLTDDERARLEQAGYLGDPGARLAELLR